MMTPDRRAKIIELAEAMQGVLDANEHYRNVRNLPGNTDRLRADTDAELDAAAERLDKAMVAWMNDALWQRNQVAVSDESFVHLLNNISGVTPSRPDELPDPPPRTADFLHPSEIYVVYERGTKGDSNA
jgi:hypothetical protein